MGYYGNITPFPRGCAVEFSGFTVYIPTPRAVHISLGYTLNCTLVWTVALSQRVTPSKKVSISYSQNGI